MNVRTLLAGTDATNAVSFLQRWQNAPVFDIRTHAEADIFVEDDEWDYDWRLMDVTATDFGIDDPSAARLKPLPMETAAAEHARYERIQVWADTLGGIVQATAFMPVIALLEDDEPDLIDGWHRVILGGTIAVVGRPTNELRAAMNASDDI